jgi:hypothetical protein
VVLLLLYLGLGLLYDWATPIFEATDEGYHFAVIRWIAQGRGLPVQDPAQGADWEQEGSQPPLYHVLSAGLTFWINSSDWPQVFVRNPFLQHIPGTPQNVNFYRHTPDQAFPYHGTTLAVHLIRWFSLGLGALTVAGVYRLAVAVFPRREGLPFLATALVAFNPKFIFVTASVNNDNLLMLLSTLILIVCLQAMQPNGRWRLRQDIGLGLLLGLAALTKVSGLVLWPLAALAVGWRVLKRERRSWGIGIWKLGFESLFIFGPALLVSGWWFWRNQQLYGEWLGLTTMVAIAGPRAIALPDLIREEWYGFYRSYWDVFGLFTILSAGWVHRIFDALTTWALLGGTWVALRRRTWPRPEPLLLGLFCLLTLAGVVRWTMQTFASQGRLMFGAIAPLSIFMAAGILAPLDSLPSRRATQFGIWILGFGILPLVAAIIPIAYIAPRYAPPPALSVADLPPDLRPVHVTFGDSIELIGYQVDDAPRLPGENLPVTLYWRAVKPMSKDYALALHVLGRQSQEEVGKLDTWPGGGNLPTSQWRPGALFADSYLLPITSTASAPSLLWLDLKFWDERPENTLPMTAPDGPIGAATFRLGRLIPALPPALAPSRLIGSTFDYGIQLIGLDSGSQGAFTLYWRTDQPVPGDYTVFVHLLAADGAQVTQKDAPPLNGDWPTSAWIPGQLLADARQFDLPADLRPGLYTLRLGLYERETGVRLGAYQPDGARWPDDAVMIEHVIEIK